MGRKFLIAIGLLLAFSLVAVASTSVDDQQQETLKAGEKISTALATVTSTAISPLLGVCVIGAWNYYHTPADQRVRLPLIQKPKFWIPVLVLLVLIFIKDTFGGFAPLIKKPLDAVEVLFVNHAALVLIAVPMVLDQVARVMGFDSLKGLFGYLLNGPVVYAATSQNAGLHHAFSVATATLYTVVGIAITIVVWLVGHAFDVLALLAPFPFLDFLLKAFRNLIFAVLALTAVFAPKIGLALALLVIVISALLFGWAWRVAVFGAIFAWELLRLLVAGSQRKAMPGKPVQVFSVGLGKVPRRTRGHLFTEEDGTLKFTCRRLLFGPKKVVVVGRSSSFEVGQGVFYPSLIEPIESSGKYRVVFRLLPTYRGAEQSVRESLGLAQVRDIRFTRGLRNFWKFVTDADEQAAAGT